MFSRREAFSVITSIHLALNMEKQSLDNNLYLPWSDSNNKQLLLGFKEF
jgi:hypothetical protein